MASSNRPGGKRPNSPRYSDRYGPGHVNPYLGGQPGQSAFIRDMEERQEAARRQSEESARRQRDAAERQREQEAARRAQAAARAEQEEQARRAEEARQQEENAAAEQARRREREDNSQPKAMRDPRTKERLRQIQEGAVREAKSFARGDEADFGDIDFIQQPPDVRLRLSEDNQPMIALESEDADGNKTVRWVPVVLSEKEMETFFPAFGSEKESERKEVQEEIRNSEEYFGDEQDTAEPELVLIPLTGEENIEEQPAAPSAGAARPAPEAEKPGRKAPQEVIRGAGLAAMLSSLPSIEIEIEPEPAEELPGAVEIPAAAGVMAAEIINAAAEAEEHQEAAVPEKTELEIPVLPVVEYDIPDGDGEDFPDEQPEEADEPDEAGDNAAEPEEADEACEDAAEPEDTAEAESHAVLSGAEAETDSESDNSPEEPSDEREEAAGEDTAEDEPEEEIPAEDEPEPEEAPAEEPAEETEAVSTEDAGEPEAVFAAGEEPEDISAEETGGQPEDNTEKNTEEQEPDVPAEATGGEEPKDKNNRSTGEPAHRPKRKRRRSRPTDVQMPDGLAPAEARTEEPAEAAQPAAEEPEPTAPRKTAVATVLPGSEYDEGAFGEDDGLFTRIPRKSAVSVFAMHEGANIPRYIDDDDFVERWLGEEEDEDLASQKKNRRRKAAAYIGAATMILALIGFIAVAKWGIGLLSNLGGSESQKDIYGEFVSPVVMSEVPVFEAWDAIPQDKLLQSAVFTVLMDNDVTYERDDTGKFIVPSTDIVNAVKYLYGASSEDAAQNEEINTQIRNALYGSAGEDVTNEDVYYVDMEDSFHVADGLSGPAPNVTDISKRDNTVALRVEYLEDLENGAGGILYARQIILNLNEDGSYYVKAIREQQD